MSRNMVLVCGGRHFSDITAAFNALDEIHRETPITCIAQGGAMGADYLATLWARQNKIPNAEYPANWKRDGKAGGPKRNEWMLRDSHPNLVVAFPGGKGTEHMVKIALAAGVTVYKPLPTPLYINPGKAPLTEKLISSPPVGISE
jgi:hypothetical protein